MMNGNIIKINENLFVVNFNYIAEGYIEGMSFNDGDESLNKLVTLSNDGKMFLNQAIPGHEKYIKFITWVMSMKDRELKSDDGFYKFFRKFVPSAKKMKIAELKKFLEQDAYKNIRPMYENIKGWEMARRENQRKGVNIFGRYKYIN